LAQAGRGSSERLCVFSSLGSRSGGSEPPACRQAAATLEAMRGHLITRKIGQFYTPTNIFSFLKNEM